MRNTVVMLLLLASCGPRNDIDPRPAMRKLGALIGRDVERDLASWQLHISTYPGPVECGGKVDRSTGCTSVAFSSREAWVRLTQLDGAALDDTPIVHELLHVWLAATTGDTDNCHARPEWAPLVHDYIVCPVRGL